MEHARSFATHGPNAPVQRALQYAVEGAKMYSGRRGRHITNLLDILRILTDEVDTCPKEQESGVTSTGMDKVDEWSSEACRTTCLCQGHGRK